MNKNFKQSVKEAEKLTVRYVNRERAKHGKDKLKFNRSLYKAAKECSKEQPKQKKKWGDYVHEISRKKGYNSSFIVDNRTTVPNTENPQKLAAKVVENWMKDRNHRANILNGSYKDTGVGIWLEGGTAHSSQLLGYRPSNRKKELTLLGVGIGYLRVLIIALVVFGLIYVVNWVSGFI